MTADRGESVYVDQERGERLIFGAEQSGLVTLSNEAAGHSRRKGCRADPLHTPEAIEARNGAKGAVAGLFHVTC